MSSPGQRSLDVLPGRGTPFSYSCAGCGRCCHDKRIQVGPYEVARIAQLLSLSTTEVLERYTDEGSALRFVDGACVFLAGQGCSVHDARPLVCRLYPLGRIALPDGSEEIVELRPHSETEGTYGKNGKVGEYFEQQGATPYINAARLYYELLERVVRVLDAHVDEATEGEEADLAPPDLLDIDLALQGAQLESTPPGDPWERMVLHISIVDDWLAANAS